MTRADALGAGISAQELKHRVRTGALIRVHRGVYRVGHRAPSYEARCMAAARACGAGAVVSGRAAAYLHGLVKGATPMPEVIAPARRAVRGVRTRYSLLESFETTHVRGIPVTTVERTLLDLAPDLSLDDLARACHEAGVRYGTTPAKVARVLERRPNAPGSKNLRAIMRGDIHVTLSELERRFLALLRQERLLLPETNRRAGTHRVDCRWPALKLTVELDSYRYHQSRYAWERDRRHEREARARGDDFRRYTYGDVCERPEVVMGELRAVLGRAGRR